MELWRHHRGFSRLWPPIWGQLSGLREMSSGGVGKTLYYETLSISDSIPSTETKTTRLAVLLHGLLGTGRNLKGFSNLLFQRCVKDQPSTLWTVVLMDMRNHGKTGVIPGKDTIHQAASDVIRTVQEKWPNAQISTLIGHSMGGKVALEITKQMQNDSHSKPPQQTWLLDSSPFRIDSTSAGTSSDVLRVLDAIRGVPLPVPDRQHLYAYLSDRGFGNMLQQWLGTNLVYHEDMHGYVWNFSLQGATAMFEDYLRQDYTDFLEHPPTGSSIHLVRALNSNRWDDTSIKKLENVSKKSLQDTRSGETRVHTLPDAGHWLHAEKPAELAALMAPSIVAT